MHPRRAIREAVADHLRERIAAVGGRVWASYDPPVNVQSVLIEQGPVIIIYTRSDRVAADGFPVSGSGYVQRTVQLVVEVIAAGSLGVDDLLDGLSESVEEELGSFEVPDQPATELRHIETEIVSTPQFEQVVGSAELRYEAKYWRAWRTDPADADEPFLPCPGDLGVIVNGGPRERLVSCEDCET